MTAPARRVLTLVRGWDQTERLLLGRMTGEYMDAEPEPDEPRAENVIALHDPNRVEALRAMAAQYGGEVGGV